MNQEKISSYQLSMVLIGFLFGSAIASNVTVIAKQDSWLAFLFGWGAGFILLLITLGIAKLHPNKTLIGIFTDCFGKIAGKIISLFFIMYYILLAAVSSKVFGYYTVTTNYSETPILFFVICTIIGAAFCLIGGIETLGRVSEIFTTIAILNVLISVFLLIGMFNLGYLKPLLENGIKPVLQAGFGTAMVPFSEIFLCLTIMPSLNNSKKLVKSSCIAFSLGGLLLFMIVLRDLLVLGPIMASREIYPMFVVFKLAPIPFSVDALLDIDVALSITIKISLCIYGAAQGIAEIFGIKEYKILIIPTVGIVIIIASLLHKTIMQQIFTASHIFPILDIPFFVILPMLVLIISLIKPNKPENYR